MSARVSLVLLTIGAVLAFAVRAEPAVIDLRVTGLILMLVGLIRPAVWGWTSYRPGADRRPPDAPPVQPPAATGESTRAVGSGPHSPSRPASGAHRATLTTGVAGRRR